MKKIILSFLIILPFMISAQNLNGRITSSFYSFQRYDNLQKSDAFLRNTEALNFNFNYDKFSLRTRVNFESNIGVPLDNDPRLRFYNLYLEARDLFDMVTVKLGRQPLFAPVSGGLFDGINVKVKYDKYAFTGFFGGNLPAYQKLEFLKDLGDNNVLGARFDANPVDHLNLAVSFYDKNYKPMDYDALRLDESLDPITVLIQQKSNQFKFLSGEAAYELPGLLDVNAAYEYDLNYNETSKIEATGKYWACENIGITGYFNWREPKIRYNSIFSVFDFGHTEEYEGGLDYKYNSDLTFFGKYGYVKYEEENSSRLTLGAYTGIGSISFRKSFGYAGELDNISLYLAKSYRDGLVTPSVGISYTSYKLSKDSETNNITSVLAGVNLRPWKTWSFDFQSQFSNNAIYHDDFRFLFKINYWFTTKF